MKANFSEKILGYLIITGAVAIAATSPFFLTRLAKIVIKESKYKTNDRQKFNNAFYYLKKRGLICIEKNKHDIVITPTEKGMKIMKRYQILELKIKQPKKWDGKIRVVAFDIPDVSRAKRNAFRRKLKELGFYSSQKSVWIHPFECRNEIKILRDFFGLNNKQIYFFTAEKVEDEFLLGRIKKVYRI
jgi:DNA-binding transcriptional regulator PaaX